MRNVILHIGHGKTGSSYLQSVLAHNIDTLAAKGIHYPKARSHQKALRGKITSGNGDLLLSGDIEFDHEITLLSSEHFVRQLLNWQGFIKLVTDYNVKVILYTRNVFDHCRSRWAQSVKRQGSTLDLNKFLQSEPMGPYPLVVDWIAASQKYGFELVMRNYSLHKADLLTVFLTDILGDNAEITDFTVPDFSAVNRSLTFSEYELQRFFNHVDGKFASTYISDPLVNRFPNEQVADIKCSQKTYEVVARALAPIVEQINQHLDQHNAIKIEAAKDVVRDTGETLEFLSEEKLKVLASSIKKRFGNTDALSDSANDIKEIAMKIEKGAVLGTADAIALMKIALKLRPSDKGITKKIKKLAKGQG